MPSQLCKAEAQANPYAAADVEATLLERGWLDTSASVSDRGQGVVCARGARCSGRRAAIVPRSPNC